MRVCLCSVVWEWTVSERWDPSIIQPYCLIHSTNWGKWFNPMSDLAYIIQWYLERRNLISSIKLNRSKQKHHSFGGKHFLISNVTLNYPACSPKNIFIHLLYSKYIYHKVKWVYNFLKFEALSLLLIIICRLFGLNFQHFATLIVNEIEHISS